MDADEYQRKAYAFDNHGRPERGASHGLAAEAAEVLTAAVALVAAAGKVHGLYEKLSRSGYQWYKRNPTEELMLELGDVQWNVAVLSHALGYSLSQVMQANIDKLTERYESEGLS